jgi:peptidoglycan/LPS O-acetylase OafA/YrhL
MFNVKLNYRQEIDGLRAIAVVSVILYHAKISIFDHKLFEGGFIGVDIFFVISGYLITSIILKELITTGSFSFKYFYERRIRRILPVLLFVILASLPFAWLYMLPNSFVDFSKSVLYSLGFSSNFYFHYSGQVYGALSGLLKPFLHTWSLSVEEQFYILFPLVLLIIFKYFRKYLIHILFLGFIISLGLAEWGSKNYPSFNFYVLPTRVWELLAGSILSYFEIIKGYKSNNRLFNTVLPALGLILIGHSILFFNDEIFHPSFYTLSPIIGVCLIIWFSNKNEIITKILSTKLFVGIGLISYSLYLWHYPIFAFARTAYIFDENEINKIFFGIITIILSIGSYYLIEKPFRNKKYNFKKLLIIILSSIVFLFCVNLYVINENGIKQRFPKIFQVKLREYNTKFYQKDNLQKVVLIGDSHSAAIEYNLNEEIKKNNLSLSRYQTRTYLKDFNFVYRKTKKIDENFVLNNNQISNLFKQNSNLIVILHNRWSFRILETYYDNEEGYKEAEGSYYNLTADYYFEPIGIKTSSQKERENLIKENLISQINYIVNQGNKLILVYPVPEMGFHVPRLLVSKYIYEKNKFTNFSPPILSGNYDVYKKRNKLIFEILDSVKNPNIYRVYPHKLFCNTQIKNRCIANDKENLFYADDTHLSLKGSELVINEIMKQIKKIQF